MKCPNDQTEMVPGNLFGHGQQWQSNEKKGESLWDKIISAGGKYVLAWRCPNCGKLELFTKTKE